MYESFFLSAPTEDRETGAYDLIYVFIREDAKV